MHCRPNFLNYEINNAKDIHEAIKDAFASLFEEMLDA